MRQSRTFYKKAYLVTDACECTRVLVEDRQSRIQVPGRNRKLLNRMFVTPSSLAQPSTTINDLRRKPNSGFWPFPNNKGSQLND